jgi:hypothetical protein
MVAPVMGWRRPGQLESGAVQADGFVPDGGGHAPAEGVDSVDVLNELLVADPH